MLTDEQRKALNIAATNGFLGVRERESIRELLAASAAPAEGREAVGEEHFTFVELVKRLKYHNVYPCDVKLRHEAACALNEQRVYIEALERDLAEARAALATAPTPCKGKNCGAADGVNHSQECRAEHDAIVAAADDSWMLRGEDRCDDCKLNRSARCPHLPIPVIATAPTMSEAVRALLAKVPVKPHAITFDKGWELLDELQRIAEMARANAEGEKS